MSTVKLPKRRGYPLVALFLVLTACCVVAALLGPALQGVFEGKIGAGDAGTAAAISGGLAMTLGGIVGAFHYHRARGFGWGILTGAVIGSLVGPLVLIPPSAVGSMIGLSIGGALVIVIVAVAFRLAAR